MPENKDEGKDEKQTDSEKKKIKNANKAKANPTLAPHEKVKNDERMEKRGVSHSPAAAATIRLRLPPCTRHSVFVCLLVITTLAAVRRCKMTRGARDHRRRSLAQPSLVTAPSLVTVPAHWSTRHPSRHTPDKLGAAATISGRSSSVSSRQGPAPPFVTRCCISKVAARGSDAVH